MTCGGCVALYFYGEFMFTMMECHCNFYERFSVGCHGGFRSICCQAEVGIFNLSCLCFSISCYDFPKHGLSLLPRTAQGPWSQSSPKPRVADVKESWGMEGLTDAAVSGEELLLGQQC